MALCPTITAHGSDTTPKFIVAMRGRDNGQRLEPNLLGECNCITTVQKDNLLVESIMDNPECINLYKEDGTETSFQNRVYKTNKIATAITTSFQPSYLVEKKIGIKQATEKGYTECKLGGIADLSYPDSSTRRGRVQNQGDTSPALTVAETENLAVIETRYRIRKLTPRECWRLMGFTDEDFNKAQSVNSNSQLYKQAGNSIVVPVLEGLFSALL